jgi:hypothetical protein
MQLSTYLRANIHQTSPEILGIKMLFIHFSVHQIVHSAPLRMLLVALTKSSYNSQSIV